ACRIWAAPARSAGSRSTSRTWLRRDSVGRTWRSRPVAWLRSASPGRTHRLRAIQPTVRERRRGGPCATRTACAIRAGYFLRDASATPLLTSAVHPRHALLPARPVAGPAPAGGDRRANRNARLSHIREFRV